MPKCKECEFYKSDEENSNKGDCFGHEVEGEMDSNDCPTKDFRPKGFEE